MDCACGEGRMGQQWEKGCSRLQGKHSHLLSDPNTIKRCPLVLMYLRSDFPDWIICCGDGRGEKKKQPCKLVFARFNALARCSVEDVLSSWRPTFSTSSPFWRVSDSQAGTLWICLFPSFPRGRPGSLGGQLTLPALRVQWMLQLGVDMLPERLPSF